MANDDVHEDELEEEQKPSEKQAEEVKKPKKKRGVLKWILGMLGVIILAVILYAGWLGFVPGLSSIMGANKPVDLGVTYTEQDLQSFYVKTGQNVIESKEAPVAGGGESIAFTNPKPLTVAITQEELTARLNASNWIYMPLSNVQVRLGDGNSIEVSGNVDVDALRGFISYIGGVNYSQADVDKGLDWLNKMSGSPAVYIDSTGSITNNQLSLSVNSVKVGRWSAPSDKANETLNIATQNMLNKITGLDTNSLTESSGMMNFDGVGPTNIYVQSK